jgi:hypothetical protein
MRADREDIVQMPSARPKPYLLVVGAAAVLVLAIPLYFVLQGPGEPVAEQPVSMPVVRDSAVVAPPVVDTAAQQQPAAAAPRSDFTERQLAPEVPTVGAGTAATAQRASEEGFVIDGPLLQEIEADAEAEAAQGTIEN